MNIFFLDECTKIAAQSHINIHCNKMILESCQMLCTANNLAGIQSPYKTTHVNHPMNVWVRSSGGNYQWTLDYARYLCEEFYFRRGKRHKSESVVEFCSKYRPNFDKQEHTDIPLCMPEELHLPSKTLSYRSYYNTCKQYDKNCKFMYIWTKRQPPEWAINPIFKN